MGWEVVRAKIQELFGYLQTTAGKGEIEKFMGSRGSGLIYSFGPGWLYTDFVFNCYLNLAHVKNALAQY